MSASNDSPIFTFSARNPRAMYSSASASVSSSGRMPIVIEVGSSRCTRPSRSTRGRPASRAHRSWIAMSSAARAPGVAGVSASTVLTSSRTSPMSRPVRLEPFSSASMQASKVSPVMSGTGVALPNPARPFSASMRTNAIRTASVVWFAMR